MKVERSKMSHERSTTPQTTIQDPTPGGPQVQPFQTLSTWGYMNIRLIGHGMSWRCFVGLVHGFFFFYREPLLFMGKTMVPCNWSFQQIPWMLVQFSSTKLPGANVIHSHARDWPPPEGVFAAGVHPPKVMWPSWTMVSHPMWEKQWHVYHQFGNDKHT